VQYYDHEALNDPYMTQIDELKQKVEKEKSNFELDLRCAYERLNEVRGSLGDLEANHEAVKLELVQAEKDKVELAAQLATHQAALRTRRARA
jgi:hypothetical protein